MKKLALAFMLLVAVLPAWGTGAVSFDFSLPSADSIAIDSMVRESMRVWRLLYAEEIETRYSRLTDEDYCRVAAELGIEPAVLHAVVDIEAGVEHRGFASPGVPVINFDRGSCTGMLKKRGVSLKGHAGSAALRPVDTRRHGNYSRAQWARLDAAREIDSDAANMSTFWGMFQIGGFNWKICGCTSADDFVRRMSRSERDQLDLFAVFMRSTGLLKHLKANDWSACARGYNGNSYAARGYHTRLAAAYRRHLAH